MEEREAIIKNERGIHLRPASLVVKAAEQYQSKILIYHGDKQGSAKEGLDLLILSLFHGEKVRVVAEGVDEKEAVEDIVALLETEFDFPLKE